MTSSLFWYKPIFMTELIIALVITTYPLKKKDHFLFRVLGTVMVLIVVALVFPIYSYNALYTSFIFIILFLIALLMLRFCYNEPMNILAFCGMIAYTTQHISYQTYNFIVTITGIGSYASMYRQTESTELNPFAALTYFGTYALIYWIVWVLVSDRVEREESLEIGGGFSKLFLSAAIVLVDVVVNAMIVFSLDGEPNPITYFAVYLQSILCCTLALGIQFTMLDRQIAVKERERIQMLWALDRQQYKRFRESVELINIKCHDLKHQIRGIRQSGGEVSRDALREIEQAISIYHCKVETGNQVLDTILAEKSLLCEYKHIRFTCVADGALLSHFAASDLYSLFGNAVSNAIEAVLKAEEEEKRVIHLTVTGRGGMVFIHVENYCPDGDQIVFLDGLPQTSKENNGYHGYGMRSMQMLAEKLGGGMEVNIAGDMFNLNICLPAQGE